MNSHTTANFRKMYRALPAEIRKQAREAYRQFLRDPYHPGLRFKKVHATDPIYSARINRDYRALGVRDDEGIVWFWIGTHNEYDKLLSQL